MIAARNIWTALGGDALGLDRVRSQGPASALPGVFPVTELSAGVVTTATLAAARLAELRDGREREVSVNRRHCAIAFRSERHLRIDGLEPASPWDAASGYYPTADGGIVQAHCNFPHHRAGVLAELGVADPGDDSVREQIAGAMVERDAQELEDALAGRGMVASRLRTPEEWRAHDQGRALSGLPIVEMIQLGEASPEPLPAGDKPLAGIRVADLTRVIAGPVCGRTLAAYGADVLRIGAAHLPVIEAILGDTNLGKRWTNLDLRTEPGAAAFRELVTGSDVVVQGYRPGGLDGLGFGAEQLASLRPGVVVASLSAYSHRGPWANRRGFDSLVQTATGIGATGAIAAGVAGTRPLPAQALDHGAGWLLAVGVMEALRRRATVGGSWLVRTSLAQVGAYLTRLEPVGAPAVTDPGDDIADLLTRTQSVEHVALPGTIDGQGATWHRAGSRSPVDSARWI